MKPQGKRIAVRTSAPVQTETIKRKGSRPSINLNDIIFLEILDDSLEPYFHRGNVAHINLSLKIRAGCIVATRLPEGIPTFRRVLHYRPSKGLLELANYHDGKSLGWFNEGSFALVCVAYEVAINLP